MNIRAGKDITLKWYILTDGEEVPLDGRKLSLYMNGPEGTKKITPILILPEENALIIPLYGKDLKRTGVYSLTLWENEGAVGQCAVDLSPAFRLVSNTGLEKGHEQGSNLKTENITIPVVIGTSTL